MAQRRSGRSDNARRVSARVSRCDLLRGLSATSLLVATTPGRAAARIPSQSGPGPRVAGPWLPVFPDLLKGAIQPTGQEVFFFGTPSGDGRWSEGTMPVWVDFGPRLFYGIPGNEGRGFQVADESRGEPFDPTGSTPEIDS